MKRLSRPILVQRLHRWLGLVFSVTVFMSAGSGVLHTVMSRAQAPPPPARPGGSGLVAAEATLPLAEAAARLDDSSATIEAANIREIGGMPWYQLFVRHEPRPFYVNASTGLRDDDADERYADEIASGFLGGTDLTRTGYLTEFDSEYIIIFRILPVYRFDANDGLGTRVYVSTTTGSVTRHTDDARQREAFVFSYFHKWMFIPNKDARDAAMILVTSGILVVASLGIVLFFLTRPRGRATGAITMTTSRTSA